MSNLSNYIDTIIQDLNQFMGEHIDVSEGQQQYTCIRTQVENLNELLKRLKEHHGFNYLANLTAVDYQDRFEVVYHIHSIPDNRKIMVKCSVNRENAELPSSVSIWKAADWQEREVFDMMGIRFINHPNLTRILLPDNFEGYPLRKDFKVKG